MQPTDTIMGQTVYALIEHRLTPEEILKLPGRLQTSSNEVIAGHWLWTVLNIDANVLADLWAKKAEYFINNPWSDEDLALLQHDNRTLHFYSPNLVTFTNSLSWDTYNINEVLRKDFNGLAKETSELLSAIDIIIVPDLSGVDFFYEGRDLTVSAYRQKANGNKLFAAEIN